MTTFKISQAQMKKMAELRSNQTGRPPRALDEKAQSANESLIAKCPQKYSLSIEITTALGRTSNNGDLANYPPPEVAKIGYFIDIDGSKDNRRSIVPVTGYFNYSKNGNSNFYSDLNKHNYDNIKRLYVWVEGMKASLWRADVSRGIAVGRIEMPVSLSHTRTLKDGTLERVFSLGILQSPVDYIQKAMAENSKKMNYFVMKNNKRVSNPVALKEWYDLTQEGNIYDYKPKISAIWGDIIRLGNYDAAVDSGAFSNFHFGYISAAAYFGKTEVMAGSSAGQRISNISRWKWPSGDPPEDEFANEQGYNFFVKHNGVERTQTINFNGADITSEKPIDSDVKFEEVAAFLLAYQALWNKLGA